MVTVSSFSQAAVGFGKIVDAFFQFVIEFTDVAVVINHLSSER
jgi:hypothetical protein